MLIFMSYLWDNTEKKNLLYFGKDAKRGLNCEIYHIWKIHKKYISIWFCHVWYVFLIWINCLIILNYIPYSIPSHVLLLNQITHSYKCRLKQKNETNAHNAMGPANYCLQLIAVSNTLLCPAIYCVKPNTVSTLPFNIICSTFSCRHAAGASCYAGYILFL